MKVNPYEVKGEINYDKLINDFGVKKISQEEIKRIEKLSRSSHHYLKREIVFAQRDLSYILDQFEKGNKFYLYTGCGPSGPIHLGHVLNWIFIKWLQDKFNTELWFQITDDEKFLFKNKTYEEIQKWTYENMLDIISLGFNPKKTYFIIDTIHAGILYKEAIKIAKKITFSTIKASFGFTDSTNIGSIFYTSMQTVPIFLPNIINKENRPCLIPLGIDQDPHFRISRDILEKLGHQKPGIMHWKFLPPLTGINGKMSSSNEEQKINLSDTPNQVKNKINKYAFSGGSNTIEEHRKYGGNPEIDVSYLWLKYLEEDDNKLNKIYSEYKSGKLLSSELKKITIEKINQFLAPIQEKRKEAPKLLKEFIYKIKHNTELQSFLKEAPSQKKKPIPE